MLPKSFEQHTPPLTTWVLIPKELLQIACVRSQVTALREGPGVDFQLQDDLVSQNDCAIVTSSATVWSHIINLKTQQHGWLHHEALDTNPKPEILQALPQLLKIKTEDLPTVFTRNVIKYAYDHPTRQSIRVKIPRGVYFPLLLAGKEYALLWIQQTNSVMWLKVDQLDIGS